MSSISEPFDPYRKWLGIPPHEQPPHYYRLLGIGLFESDPDVIQESADRQMAHVQRHKLGTYSALSQKLLNELATARLCLLQPEKRAAYDRQLRASLAPRPAASPVCPAQSASAANASASGIRPAASAPSRPAAAPQASAAAPQAGAARGKVTQRDPAFDFIEAAAEPAKPRSRNAAPKKSPAGSKTVWIVAGSVAAALAIGAITVGVQYSRRERPVAQQSSLAGPSAKADEPPGPETANSPGGQPSAGDATAAKTPASVSGGSDPAAPSTPQSEHAPGPEAPESNGPQASQLASTDVLDLLPLVKLNANGTQGKWQKTRSGLILLPSEHMHPLVPIPLAPPNEYQLEAIVEPQPGAELILGLVAGGHQVAAVLDGWGGKASGLHVVDGQSANANPSTHEGKVLTSRKPNRLLITVRGDRIEIACDDKSIIRWQGPFERLGMNLPDTSVDRRSLFIGGSAKSAFRIRSLKLATISGRAQDLTVPAAPGPPLARVEPPVAQPTPTANPAPAPQPAAGPAPVASGGFALAGHPDFILGIAVSPDSKQAVTVGRWTRGANETARIWNLEKRKLRGVYPPLDKNRQDASHNAIAFSPDGGQLHVAGDTGLWSVDFAPEASAVEYFGPTTPVLSVTISADGQLLCAGGSPVVNVFAVRRPAPVASWTSPTRAPVNAVALSPDGMGLLAGCGGRWLGDRPEPGQDYRLHVIDLRGLRPDAGNAVLNQSVELTGHTGCIWSVAVSRDGARAVSGSHDATLRVWDLKALKPGRVLSGHAGPVFCVAISPDGRLALSGGADQSVRLWNLDTGRELKRFDGHAGSVRAVALTPDGKLALSGGHDKMLRVWEIGAFAKGSRIAVKPGDKPGRAAVPAASAVEQAQKLIRDVFADDFKQAKKAPERIALAEKMLKQAADAQNDAERYALLSEARTLAAASGSPALIVQVIEQTADRFQVDAAHQIADAAEQLAKDALPATARRELAELLMPLAEAAAADSDFDLARRLLTVAGQAARKTNDAALIKIVTSRTAEINENRKAFELYQRALVRLKAAPTDDAAHLAAGRYLCFVRDDWPAGLEHLAQGSDDPLKQVAALDLKNPELPEDQLKLADLWWALVEPAKGKDKLQYAERAERYYTAALPGLKGLAQTKVGKRLEELAAIRKTSTSAPADNERSPAALAGGSVPAKIVSRIKTAIKKDALVRTANVAGRTGVAFAEIPPAGVVLAGFNYTLSNENGGWITSIQPIYLSSKGSVNGGVWGVEAGPVKTVVAKKGYAVSGVRAGGSGGDVRWFEVLFAKLGPNGLDLADKYNSTWTGPRFYAPTTMGNNGQLVVGICGAADGSQLTGLGLVQMPAN